MQNGQIVSHHLNPKGAFTADQYYNGLRRYTQTALVLGMDAFFRDCHSRFVINFSTGDKHYDLVGEFIFNKSGENLTSEKIDHLIYNPSHLLIAAPKIGDIRYMWPGAIRIPHIGTDSELIIANSGVPDDMDVTLIAAFAIGINELDSNWSLENFHTNNQYAWALRKAARFIIISTELGLDYHKIISDEGFNRWLEKEEPYTPMTGILKEALENL